MSNLILFKRLAPYFLASFIKESDGFTTILDSASNRRLAWELPVTLQDCRLFPSLYPTGRYRYIRPGFKLLEFVSIWHGPLAFLFPPSFLCILMAQHDSLSLSNLPTHSTITIMVIKLNATTAMPERIFPVFYFIDSVGWFPELSAVQRRGVLYLLLH
ncbi:hypothetical protein K469DRAFT_193193 [Zopfia rhizophila CBS 207.26]|uniref:Uncharacterized protein n=1 Tax=Zopfia rhizophila CBS 207.26 TaxID=1314779 RepID=A0A6A6ET47_9PEZI|nr:hypothetical protein K469DRAFT_193193 [Zopfia rhizophila CBS 207.26]